VAKPAAAPAPAPGADAAEGGPRMLLVDVVLLSTQEMASTSKGVNLLNALTLQLGSATGNLAAFSRVFTGNDQASSTTFTRAVTVPALSYSLNIANANNSVNEVLARPTLAAIEGLPSEFFSGVNLSAGLVSTSQQGGTTIVPLDKRFGIKLAITPTFLPQGRVQMKVEAQRTSLNASAENPRAAYQIEIGETTANANVVMKMGDTLVLSGLSEKSSSSTRDGVPGLQDVPVVQYMFSNRKTNEIQRSVLILVTPRAPAQVAEAGAAAAEPMATRMQALRQQFGFAGGSPSNVEAIMSQMQTTELFREFRQGDVAMERWDRLDSTGARLREALGFLYY
jgi:type II secretory pathway component GspD/PulD (secretin)